MVQVEDFVVATAALLELTNDHKMFVTLIYFVICFQWAQFVGQVHQPEHDSSLKYAESRRGLAQDTPEGSTGASTQTACKAPRGTHGALMPYANDGLSVGFKMSLFHCNLLIPTTRHGLYSTRENIFLWIHLLDPRPATPVYDFKHILRQILCLWNW